MFCTKCGGALPEGTRYCTLCGAAQQDAGGGPAPSSFGSFGGTPPRPAGAWVPPTGVKADVGRWIGAGWELVKPDLGMWVLAALLMLVINSFVPFILQGPLVAGFHIICIRKIFGGQFDIGDLFKGFQFFLPALLAALVSGIFIGIGTLLCLIPGLVVAAMYVFVYLFIVDKKMDFWPAMQASHAVVKQDYFGFTMLVLAGIGLSLVGVLLCLVGVLVTIPIYFAAITVAYKEVVGFEPGTASSL